MTWENVGSYLKDHLSLSQDHLSPSQRPSLFSMQACGSYRDKEGKVLVLVLVFYPIILLALGMLGNCTLIFLAFGECRPYLSIFLAFGILCVRTFPKAILANEGDARVLY